MQIFGWSIVQYHFTNRFSLTDHSSTRYDWVFLPYTVHPFMGTCYILLFARNHTFFIGVSVCVCVCPYQMHEEPMKSLLNASPPGQDAAEPEADGAEVFKACRRVDWCLLARVAKQSTDAGRYCDRVRWNGHHDHTLSQRFKKPYLSVLLRLILSLTVYFLLLTNQWQQVSQWVRKPSRCGVIGAAANFRLRDLQRYDSWCAVWRTGDSSDECWGN